MLILFSNFLSSQIASNQVLSAFTSLTSVFDMGTIWEEMHNKKSTSYEMLILFSNFLSSQIASNQVLSAFTSLTSVFDMGTGVSL